MIDNRRTSVRLNENCLLLRVFVGIKNEFLLLLKPPTVYNKQLHIIG